MAKTRVNIKAKAMMKTNEGNWLLGFIKKGSFHMERAITNMEEVKTIDNVEKFMSLKKYLALQGRKITLSEDILLDLDAEELYLLPKSEDSVPVRSKGLGLCDTCVNTCSHNTVIFRCSKYAQVTPV